MPFDPSLDLILERVVDVPRKGVWRAWTEPELLKQWFTPAPYETVDCEIDLRPGGVFRTVMCSPEGETSTNAGCFLEILDGQRLVFTDALGPGYRPREDAFFTAAITLTSEGAGTRYHAHAMHRDEAGRTQHEEMGFYEGWGAALDQLVDLVHRLPI
jgi:uncharacterized protein YndB with AHSA1/START domain